MKFLPFFLLFVFSVSALSADCWDVGERSKLEFDELDGKITLSVKNAKDCKPVQNPVLEVNGKKISGDRDGYITVEELGDFGEESVSVTITAKGFVDLPFTVPLDFGSPRIKRFLLSPALPPGKARFVLQWGESPRDLDLHLQSDDFHISYRNKQNITGKAKLDRDDTDSFGPETITLDKILPEKTYRIFVRNYSREKPFNDEGYIQIYIDNRLYGNIRVTPGNSKDFEVGQIRNRGFVQSGN